MKKVLIGILALIMVLGLVGCGKSKEAKNVEKLISSIGTVTIDSSEAIQSARNSYDALNEEQEKEIENIKTLTDAEKSFAKLAQEESVEELISSIGTVTLDSSEAIQSARNGYNALSEEQKKEIENITTLTDAEKAFVELAQEESKWRLLDRQPGDAIAILEEALLFDSAIQDDIDIIYEWCFEINGKLIIKPDFLYTGVEFIGVSPNDSEHELDSYFYSLVDADDFVDYIKYIDQEFMVNHEETLESASFIKYQFLDKYSREIAMELSLFEYNGDLFMRIEILPKSK